MTEDKNMDAVLIRLQSHLRQCVEAVSHNDRVFILLCKRVGDRGLMSMVGKLKARMDAYISERSARHA